MSLFSKDFEIKHSDEVNNLSQRATDISASEYSNLRVATANGFDYQPSIQKAIDVASISNKRAYVPEGTYILNNPLKLGDNATLVLHENAKLVRNFNTQGTSGSTIQNKDTVNGNKNIKVVGGSITCFDNTKTGKHIGFWGVDGLQIIGTRIRGAHADWMTIFRKCTRVVLDGLDMDALSNQFDSVDLFTDGIHFCGGSDIVVANCIVNSVDDAIAFTVENSFDDTIKNVTVSNCILNSRKASAIKIMLAQPVWTASTTYAVGNSVIVVNGPSGGNVYVCTVAGTTGTVAPTHTSGTATDGTVTWQFISTTPRTDLPSTDKIIQNITINNIRGKIGYSDVNNAGIAIWIDDRSGLKRIQDITFSNIQLDCTQAAGSGAIINYVNGIDIDNVKMYKPQGTGFVIQFCKDVYMKRPKVFNPRVSTGNGITLQQVDFFTVNEPIVDLATGSTGNGVIVGIVGGYTSRYGSVTNGRIRIDQGTAISLQCTNGVDVKNNYCSGLNGIIETNEAGYNFIAENNLMDITGTKLTRNADTANAPALANTSVARANKGYVTERRSSQDFTNPASGTSPNPYMTISHGLSIIPSSSGIRLTPMGPLNGINKYWIDTITATTFRINADVLPSANVTFAFEVNASKNI
jgi:hypothetical protein